LHSLVTVNPRTEPAGIPPNAVRKSAALKPREQFAGHPHLPHNPGRSSFASKR